MLSAGLGSELPLTRPRSRSIACHLKHPPIAAKLLLALAFWNVRDVDLSDVQPDVPPVPASSFDRVEPLQRGGSAAAEVRAAAQRGAYMRLASVPAAAPSRAGAELCQWEHPSYGTNPAPATVWVRGRAMTALP